MVAVMPHDEDVLTPEDVAKMAAAGVKIAWTDVQYRLRRPLPPQRYLVGPDGNFRMDTPDLLLSQLEFRMKWPEKRKDGMHYQSAAPALDFINVHKLNDEKVAVFVVRKGEAITLYDDWMLYPSDALVTQLRLLENT
jgi:hypothetical protein